MQIREQGVIKQFNSERGFGFIVREGCPDLFFHISALEPGAGELIQQGMRVVFEVKQDERDGRMRAATVELLYRKG